MAGAVVQHASVFSAPYANPTITLPSPVAPGNMLLAFAGWGAGTTSPVVSDDDPDSVWRVARFGDLPGGSYSAGVWRSRVHTAGTRTVTFAPPPGADFIRFAVVEVSGVNAVDESVTNGETPGSTPATIDAGTVTPQSANELVFGWMISNSSGAVGPAGAGFAALDSVQQSLLQVAVGPPAGTPLAVSCTNATPNDGYVAIGVSMRYAPVPVLEQHGSVNSSGAASVSVTLPAKIEKGNAVVALASFAGTAGTTVFADDAGDTYATIDSTVSAVLGFAGAIAWAKVTANGGSVVSLTPDSGHANRSFIRLFVFEYSNVQGFDGAHASADGVSTAIQTTVATAHPNAVIVGQGISNDGTVGAAMLAGSTRRETVAVESAYDAPALTPGSYTTGFVAGGATEWFANSAAFYAPATGTALARGAVDIVPVADSVTAPGARSRSALDIVTVADSARGQDALVRGAVEIVPVADSAQGQGARGRGAVDIVAVTDSALAPGALARGAVDIVAVADGVILHSSFVRSAGTDLVLVGDRARANAIAAAAHDLVLVSDRATVPVSAVPVRHGLLSAAAIATADLASASMATAQLSSGAERAAELVGAQA